MLRYCVTEGRLVEVTAGNGEDRTQIGVWGKHAGRGRINPQSVSHRRQYESDQETEANSTIHQHLVDKHIVGIDPLPRSAADVSFPQSNSAAKHGMKRV